MTSPSTPKTLSIAQVLAFGATIVTLSMGIRHGFGLWLQPITQAQGWTRENFALAIAVQNISWGFFGIFAGMVADKFGALPLIFGTLLSSFLALLIAVPLSLAALFVSGFVDMISVNIRATMLAILTPLRLQGRVNAVEWVFISASNELGAFEAGAMASLLGPVRAVVLGGVSLTGGVANIVGVIVGVAVGSGSVVACKLGMISFWPSVIVVGSAMPFAC